MSTVLNFIRNYPFLFFIVPFVIGIVFTDSFFYKLTDSFYWIQLVLLVTIFFLLLLNFIRSYPFRWLFGINVFLFFILLGVTLTYWSLSETMVDWSPEKEFYSVRVKDDPREKENSYLCMVEVKGIHKNGVANEIRKNVSLYVIKDSLSKQIKCGDQLIFYGKISSPENNGNPGEFDYKWYLYHQNISGTGIAFSGQWEFIRDKGEFNIKEVALQFRKKMLSRYELYGINGDELGVLSAISLGYKNDLSEEIKNAYSITGTSHVLALSGLHIGLLFFLLNFLGTLLFRDYRLRVLKAFFILLFLWGFAFISGLSPSIVRAVCMCSGLVLFQLIYRTPLTFHLLTFTGFFMLLYNPFYLFDISFQLSFVSVASILLMYPWLHQRIVLKNKLLNYIWSLFSISLIAQIGTMPIVIYYFGNFPVYSLLSNLLIVPLITLLLYVVVIFWLFAFSSFLQGYIIIFIDKITSFINPIIYKIEGIPFSSIKSINLELVELYGYYIILLMVILFIKKRDIYQLRNALLTFLFINLFQFYRYATNEITPSIVFYNTGLSAIAHLIESGNNSLVVIGGEENEIPAYVESIIQRFCLKKQIVYPDVRKISELSNAEDGINGIIHLGNKIICFLTDENWKNKVTDYPLIIDYLYINKNFKGEIKELAHLFKIKNVVFNGSTFNFRAERLKQECEKFDIPLYCLSDGALVVDLTKE